MRRDEVLILRRAVTLLNGHLREIVIQVNSSTKTFERGAELLWPALFSLTTQLRKLIVSDMPTLYSTEIVDTAMTYCGALTTIDVSGNFIHDRTTDSSIAETLQPALKKHQQGGLEVFNAAFVAETDRYARFTAYINSLCDSCPKIQVLNGWNSVSDILQADEQWIIDEITWERFCRICTDLRSFN